MVSVAGGALLFCLLLGSSFTGQTDRTNDLDIYYFHVKSEVSSRYAVTVITSRVANRASEPREVDFHVELPKNAFISKFVITIDGKAYNGEVKKKEEAQEQYSRAVARGETAGLVSAVGRTLEEFKTSVTVAAHSKVSFELTYEELLKRRLGKYELLIKVNSTQVVKDFQVDVWIFERQGIRFLETRGGLASNDLASAITTNQTNNEALVRFSPSLEQQQCPGCGDGGLSGELLVVYDVNRPKSQGDLQVVNGYFVHYFAPTDLPRIPKNVVFVIDQSGSMSGKKMEQTQDAMLKILDDLHEEDHFGLVLFHHLVTAWRFGVVPANGDNLAAARTFVQTIRSRGMTNINDAVLKGVQMLATFEESNPQKESTSIVFLLTDGDPNTGVTSLSQIHANVREAIRKRYTLYCLGFGFDVNLKFLEKMALENGGLARRIYEDSDAALQLKGFYEEVATPLLLDVKMNYLGASDITQTNFGQYYDGSEIVVAGRLNDNDLDTLTAEVKAKTKYQEVTFREEVRESEVDASMTLNLYIFETYIQRLWAYLTVRQLLERQVLLPEEQQEAVREQVLALSLNYSFVTPLTSMVVTKPEGEDSQVAHKPKEGPPPSEPRTSGHRVLSGGTSGRVLSGGTSGSVHLARSQADPLITRVTAVMYMEPAISTSYKVKVMPAPTPVLPMSHMFKILLPTQGLNASICFRVKAPKALAPKQPVIELLHDPATGVSVDAEISQEGHCLTVDVRHKGGCHVRANTTGILVTQDGNETFIPWTTYAMSHHCDGITINLQNETLEVNAGNIHLDILWHQNGQNSFLWPAFRQQEPIPNARGLLGLSPVSYILKETTPVVKLEILGKEVLATRDSTADYSTHAKPKVNCWLVPFSSVVP